MTPNNRHARRIVMSSTGAQHRAPVRSHENNDRRQQNVNRQRKNQRRRLHQTQDRRRKQRNEDFSSRRKRQELNRPKRIKKSIIDDGQWRQPDIHLKLGSGLDSTFDGKLSHNDIVLVQELICPSFDLMTYDKVNDEIHQVAKKKEEPLIIPWHEKAHSICNDKLDNGEWKKDCPTLEEIIDKTVKYFGIQVSSTRVNVYKGSDFKHRHFDQAKFKPQTGQNITVSISLGATRPITFEHADTKTMIDIDAPNGSVYTFGKHVNEKFRHGLRKVRCDEGEDADRISIVIWGSI